MFWTGVAVFPQHGEETMTGVSTLRQIQIEDMWALSLVFFLVWSLNRSDRSGCELSVRPGHGLFPANSHWSLGAWSTGQVQ